MAQTSRSPARDGARQDSTNSDHPASTENAAKFQQNPRSSAALALLDLLAERFPRAFFRYQARRKPLKIGIHADILAALDGAIEPDELSWALNIYVHNEVYRSRLVVGAWRYDLEGKPAGSVSPEHAMARPPRHPQRDQRDKPVAVKPAPAKRMSLAGLRDAARCRKAGVP